MDSGPKTGEESAPDTPIEAGESPGGRQQVHTTSESQQAPQPQPPRASTEGGPADEGLVIKPCPDDEDLSEASDVAVLEDDDSAYDDELDARPLHLHVMAGKSKARLQGSGSVGARSSRSRSRSTSRSRGRGTGRHSAPSSRSASPLPGQVRYDQHHGDGSLSSGVAPPSSTRSVLSKSFQSESQSFDGIFDQDVLLDQQGFVDLDPPLPCEIRCPLGTVNERLSEDTLEDCHAFQNLAILETAASSSGGGKNNFVSGGLSTISMPSVAHSSLSGVRSDMSVGSLSVGSFGKGGQSSRGGGASIAGSYVGDGESVLLGPLVEEGEDDESDAKSAEGLKEVKEVVAADEEEACETGAVQ